MNLQSRDESLNCSNCHRKFTHKSSLVRHLKRCLSGLKAPSRQKSCQNCSTAKAGCDLQRPSCGRCQARSLRCEFLAIRESSRATSENDLYVPQLPHDVPPPPSADDATRISEGSNEQPIQTVETAKIVSPKLLLSPERRQILLGTAPGAPVSDAAVRHTMHFVIRVLKSWPRLIAMHHFAQLPPVVHKLQLESGVLGPLARCHALACMWATHTPDSSDSVQNAVVEEIERLRDQYSSCTELDLLATAQSILFLLILLFFGFEKAAPVSRTTDAELLISVWDVKHALASTGLFLEEEATNRLPRWKEWAIVSAKRRTILALNHLEWVWSLKHGFPVLSCFELGPLPAPAAGYLWQEPEEKIWERLYKEWMRNWGNEGYKMFEFFHIDPAGTLDQRSEMWLAEADAYGVMLMAEVNAVGNSI
ncbi:hypothetical protein DM02DRAFT_35172 [Periconia macrospinosa]|uniref:Zn(2)-C6 fungal-type domain-containing protein n=1 Tax=Periconia macrospinosa TaxID=97972 RepID=A0A2V1E700_9PLEO|nr:hypothetical protein DM02DRAFT_35172 [Periconia macrospinosa]